MTYSKTKAWMSISDTRRYLKLGRYKAMAILEDEEGNVIIRQRDYGSTYDIDCKDIKDAEERFKMLAKCYAMIRKEGEKI